MTDLNVTGLAATLTFAGFRIVDVDDYPNIKRRVAHLYDLRSRAVHRADFGHIEIKDIDDLSYWVAWIIISMAALSTRNYRTLRQVQTQVRRLDQLLDKANAGPVAPEADRGRQNH